MLSISLDEGAVFDILAINVVKHQRKPTSNLTMVIEEMKKEIATQIGLDKINEILSSLEFKELVKVNDDVFDLIDAAQTGEGLARAVQDGNRKRYNQKILLQRKYFHDKITEEKI
jgi:hypothetical protein